MTPACELVPEAVCLLLIKLNLVPWVLQLAQEKLKYERPEEGVPGVGVLVDRFLRVLLQLLDSWNKQVQRILHLTAELPPAFLTLSLFQSFLTFDFFFLLLLLFSFYLQSFPSSSSSSSSSFAAAAVASLQFAAAAAAAGSLAK